MGNTEQTSTVYEDLSSFFNGYDGTFVLLDLKRITIRFTTKQAVKNEFLQIQPIKLSVH